MFQRCVETTLDQLNLSGPPSGNASALPLDRLVRCCSKGGDVEIHKLFGLCYTSFMYMSFTQSFNQAKYQLYPIVGGSDMLRLVPYCFQGIPK